MAYDTTYTGREIIKMIHEAPDVDYVGEYLTGRILGDESFKIQEKELCERKEQLKEVQKK